MVFFFKTKEENLITPLWTVPTNIKTVPELLNSSTTKYCETTKENSGAPKKIKKLSKTRKKKAVLAKDPKDCGGHVPYVSHGNDSCGWSIKSSTPPANEVTIPGPLVSSATKYCGTTEENSGTQLQILENPTKIKKLSKKRKKEAFLAKDSKDCGGHVPYVSHGNDSCGWNIKSSTPPANKVTIPGPLVSSATIYCGTTVENSGSQLRILENPTKIKKLSKKRKKEAFLAKDSKDCGGHVPYVTHGINSRGLNIKSSTPPTNKVTIPGLLVSSATKYCGTTEKNSESPTKVSILSKTGRNEALFAYDPKYCRGQVPYVPRKTYSGGCKLRKWLARKPESSTKIKQRNKSTNTNNEFDIHIVVLEKDTKYNSLFRSMSANVVNLNQGYRCLELFRKAEKAAKSKKEMSCAKGYVIGGVKFVMRNQFYEFKQLKDDVITPLRFASIVTLAADSLFRRKLLYDYMKKDSAAITYAHQMIKNPFADKHGFGADKVPDTVEDMKLYYYYLTMTIGVHALMDTRPHICMAIAKWRFHGKHPMRLRLHNNVLNIDEVYASCLRALWTSSYETPTNASTMPCNPIDFIKNKSLLRKISNEFEFLKTHASSPTQLAM